MIWVAMLLLAVAGAAVVAGRRGASQEAAGLVQRAGLVLLLLACALLSLSFLTVVPAGHVGVPVVFGKVQETYVPEGLHAINPFANVESLSVRTETYTMVAAPYEGAVRGDDSIYALSADQVQMSMDVTVAYRLVDADAPWIYRHLGRHFVESIVRPAARSAVPEATAHYLFQEAAAGKRQELADKVRDRLAEQVQALLRQYDGFRGSGIIIQQVYLRRIEPPQDLKNSIVEKMKAEQDALRMKFILQKEEQEAARKRIEAQGIRDFQAIVTQGISDKLLQWKGIEATELLARSPNAKVVVVGNGKGSLPVLLSGQ